MSYLNERIDLILDNIDSDSFYEFTERHENNKKNFDYFFYKFSTQSYKVKYLTKEIDFYYEFFETISKKINLSLSKVLTEKKKEIDEQSNSYDVFSFYLILFQYAEQFEYLYREANLKTERVDAFLNIFNFK